MRYITLKFNTANDLIEFIKLTESLCQDFDKQQLMITCSLTDAEVELAHSAYHAVVVHDHSMN